jgi:hypothetical protein
MFSKGIGLSSDNFTPQSNKPKTPKPPSQKPLPDSKPFESGISFCWLFLIVQRTGNIQNLTHASLEHTFFAVLLIY